MSDREFLRRALFLFASAGLMLAACIKHEPTVCGEQEACPSGSYCNEGVCESTSMGCPDQPPLDETVIASVDLRCNYGEECCCGVCHPNMICSALAGEEIGCFFSEACMLPQCDAQP
jgi:hypothetical protein